MSTYHHHEHIETPAGRTDAVVSRRHISPGQVLGGLAGIAIAAIGILVLVRTGIDSTLNQPVTTILGAKQSAYVGGFEAVVGLMMVASCASVASRGVLGFLGALTLLAGIFLAAASDRILLEVGATHGAGVVGIVLGAVALLGALMPSFVRTEREVVAR